MSREWKRAACRKRESSRTGRRPWPRRWRLTAPRKDCSSVAVLVAAGAGSGRASARQASATSTATAAMGAAGAAPIVALRLPPGTCPHPEADQREREPERREERQGEPGEKQRRG